MKLIIGLGNHGEKYISTRHNLGFMIIEQFFKDYATAKKANWNTNKTFKSDVVDFLWTTKLGEEEKIILAKPNTFMNNSGLAASLLVNFYKIPLEDVWVLHDDIDIPLGGMKIRFSGSSAGHKGIESIIAHMHSEKFWRFRMGIGASHRFTSNDEDAAKNQMRKFKLRHVEEFVVSPFDHNEAGKVRELIKRGSKAIKEALEDGLSVAMNKYNTK